MLARINYFTAGKLDSDNRTRKFYAEVAIPSDRDPNELFEKCDLTFEEDPESKVDYYVTFGNLAEARNFLDSFFRRPSK